jgi:hypothetical protein
MNLMRRRPILSRIFIRTRFGRTTDASMMLIPLAFGLLLAGTLVLIISLKNR